MTYHLTALKVFIHNSNKVNNSIGRPTR